MYICMRTTVLLDDHLLSEAKAYAARTGRTFTALVSDTLREVLARRKPAGKPARTQLPTFKGNGVRPGVDLDNNAALLDLMEQDHAPR